MKFIDGDIVIMCAFRYALGRRTYVVSAIASEIVRNWYCIEDSVKKLIHEEISKCEDLGMECDRNMWIEILNLPINEI